MAKLTKKKESNKINPKELLSKRYADRIQEDLEDQGVDFFVPTEDGSLNIDSDYLELPENITDITAKELGEHLNAFTQKKMYIRTLIGWSECMEEEAKQKYQIASNEKYKLLSKTKLSETAKEREINMEEDIIPFHNEYVEFKRKTKLLKLNIESIEDAIFLISREIARRSGDFKDDNRNHNIGRN